MVGQKYGRKPKDGDETRSTQLSVRMTKKLKARLEAEAKRQTERLGYDITMADVVNKIVTKVLDQS
jgi:hypothetical protein